MRKLFLITTLICAAANADNRTCISVEDPRSKINGAAVKKFRRMTA